MKKIIYYEVLKLQQRRTVWLVIAGLLLANSLLVYYQANQSRQYGYSVKDEWRIYEELAKVSPEQQADWIDSEIERIYSTTSPIDPSSFHRVAILNAIQTQLEAVSTYDQYLANINYQADRMLSSPIFAEPGSFAYLNIERTPGAYAHLFGLEPPLAFSGGVLLLTDNWLLDAPLMLSLLVLAMHLLISEREEGTLVIIKATAHGYLTTAVAKAVVLLVLSALGVLLFYGETIAVIMTQVGLGDLSRPIQSLEGYLTSPQQISVLGYLGWFWVAKVASVFTLLALFYAICIITRNNTYACVAAFLIFGVHLYWYQSIDVHSALSPLAYFNLAAILNTGSYFYDYINVNVFGHPMQIVASGCWTAALTIGTGLGSGIYLFTHEGSSLARANRAAAAIKQALASQTTRLAPGRHTNLFRHEAYKLLVMNKGLAVLAVLFVAQALYMGSLRYWTDREEYYYQQYSALLAGDLTETKRQLIEDETDRIAAIELEEQAIRERFERGDIDRMYMDFLISRLEIPYEQRAAFERASTQYKALESMADDGERVSYVYQTGWVALLGADAWRDDIAALAKVFACLTVGLSALGSIDKTTHVETIILASACGKQAVSRVKAKLCIGFATISCIATYAPKAVRLFSTYGFNTGDLTVKVDCLTALDLWPSSIPLMFYLLLRASLYLAVAATAALAVYKLSDKTGNMLTTMLVSAAVLLLPLAVVLLV
ncbi:MAG: hypothetical protein FWH40_07110 [Coriobacteriia bacterium]|nr:hypothetical protein [Coriobacteriia bacterium]